MKNQDKESSKLVCVLYVFLFIADLQVQLEIESELSYGDIYLQCITVVEKTLSVWRFWKFQLFIAKEGKDSNHRKLLTARDKDGYTLLHWAAAGGSKDIFKALKEATHEIKIDDTTYGGHTVLHIACKHMKLCMCAYL